MPVLVTARQRPAKPRTVKAEEDADAVFYIPARMEPDPELDLFAVLNAACPMCDGPVFYSPEKFLHCKRPECSLRAN